MAEMKTMNIDVDDVAAALGYSGKAFKEELALIGWNVLMNEADRLASSEHFHAQLAIPQRERSLYSDSIAGRHVLAAAAGLVQPKKPLPSKLESCKIGSLYHLYDAKTGLSKIGCTRGTSAKRQRSIIGGHSTPHLVNIVNAKVADRFAAESQCHEHFKAHRVNGEWFQIDPNEIIRYIHETICWLEIEYPD